MPSELELTVSFYPYFEKCTTREEMEKLYLTICLAAEMAMEDTINEVFGDLT